MTPPSLPPAMDPEQQRIAIATACGWKVENVGVTTPKGNFVGRGYKAVVQMLPDYLHSLDAMHEAEKVLTETQRYTYTHKLLLIFERTSNAGSSSFDFAHATAAQRAEAFLRTLNLWTPTK